MDKINKLFSTKIINGKFCSFHHVDIDDAQLIFDLRTKRKDSFLKATDGTVDDQKRYLENYLRNFGKDQIYYKIFDVQTQKFCGVLRLTELDDKINFNWQSFVVAEGSSPNVPIDAMLMVYRIGFEYLGRKICGPWEVDRDFAKMIKIHQFLNMAKIVDENEKYFLFAVKDADYFANVGRFLKMNYGQIGGLL